MKYIQPEDRNQLKMLSSLDQSISSDNPIRIIDVLVEKIFLVKKKSLLKKN